MRKVLILAHDFPPYNSVGALRPYSWFFHLAGYGIYPVVVTRHWDEDIKSEEGFVRPSSKQEVEVIIEDKGTIIRVPYRSNMRDRLFLKYGNKRFVIFRKTLSALNQFFKFWTFSFDNTRAIYDEARKYIMTSGCDAIIATGQPFFLFRYASVLSSEFSIPWIADYRDGWSTNLRLRYSHGLDKKLLVSFYRFVEKRYLRNVKLITIASPTFAQDLKELAPDKQTFTVFNGYEDGLVQRNNLPSQNHDEFMIAYSGRLYQHQPIEVFLEGFRKFMAAYPDAKTSLVFFGLDFFRSEAGRLLKAAGELSASIRILSRMPYHDYMMEMAKANLLLLLTSSKVEWGTTKIFDYFATGRKILLVENDNGLLKNMINDCGGGFICDDAEDVYVSLCEAYQEFIQHGRIDHESLNFEKYSRNYQAGILAGIIEQCAE